MHGILVGKPRRRWDDSILYQTSCGDGIWLKLDQDLVQWWYFVSVVLNPCVLLIKSQLILVGPVCHQENSMTF